MLTSNVSIVYSLKHHFNTPFIAGPVQYIYLLFLLVLLVNMPLVMITIDH